MTPIKIFKYLGALVGTILLGAIGSGVWERILAPFLNSVSNNLTKFLSQISVGFSDSLYADAAWNFGDQSIDPSAIHFLFFISIFLILTFFKIKSNTFSELLNGFTQSVPYMVSIIFIFTVAFFLISRTNSINQINRISSINMETMRPYIGEQKYLELRSDYLRIKNEAAFDRFQNKLNKYATENGLTTRAYPAK
jgi:hypothetical protein